MSRTKFMPEIGGTSGSGNYFRMTSLKEGPAKVRILSEAITGYEGWTENNKPIRSAEMRGFPEGTKWRSENGKTESPKFFMAFFVWNHAAGKVQVLSMTQKTIMQQLTTLDEHPDWGDPRYYDVTLTRTDSGDKVSYSVQPSPVKPLPAEAEAEWERVQNECIGLEALFRDENPMDLAK